MYHNVTEIYRFPITTGKMATASHLLFYNKLIHPVGYRAWNATM